jgi:NADH-quinone oxidoreductase subunit L
VVLALLSLAGGWIQLPHVFGGHPYFNEFLATVVRNAPMAEEGLSTLEYMLLGGTVLLLTVIYFLARKKYAVSEYAPDFSGYKKWPANKWFVDEFYDFLVVRPLQWLNKNVIAFVEREVIDWIVNGVGKAVQLGSRQARLLQSGQVGSYVLLMVLGMLVFFAIELLVLRK